MVTRDEVIYAFRFLLGRDPESVTVINQFLPTANWANLRELFLASDEFRRKAVSAAYIDGSKDYVNSPPNPVDVEISPAHLDRLIEHVQSSWEALGREQPHWSVLTNPMFLPGNIDANSESFYSSGERGVDILEKAAARAGKDLPSSWTCFELGCGVGRITAYLARRFHFVTAADISSPHLQLAGKHLDQNSIANVSLVQLTSLEILETIEPFDIFYSIIVLQHNPPPLIYRMLHIILEKLKIGGCAYFQLPVAYPGYRFSIEEYLTSIENGQGTMEMHALPQPYLFRVLEKHKFRILDLQRDNWTGPGFHSITIFAEKTNGPESRDA